MGYNEKSKEADEFLKKNRKVRKKDLQKAKEEKSDLPSRKPPEYRVGREKQI